MMLTLILVASMKLPNPTLTPGVVNPTVTTAIACSTKWGADRRVVTETMKRSVALSYGLLRRSVVGYGSGSCCEFDHLISRELGGADDVKNLWPQPWTEAKLKDQLENRLHAMVCATPPLITLAAAQWTIRTNWPAAYQQYVITR